MKTKPGSVSQQFSLALPVIALLLTAVATTWPRVVSHDTSREPLSLDRSVSSVDFPNIDPRNGSRYLAVMKDELRNARRTRGQDVIDRNSYNSLASQIAPSFLRKNHLPLEIE